VRERAQYTTDAGRPAK